MAVEDYLSGERRMAADLNGQVLTPIKTAARHHTGKHFGSASISSYLLWATSGSQICAIRLRKSSAAVTVARHQSLDFESCFLQFRPDELDRAGCLPVEVVVAGQVAIDRNVTADFAAGDEEGFHHQRALIVDVAQRGENLLPRHPATSGRTPVRFAEMEVAQTRSRLTDCPSDAVFLDIEVEGVQMDFAVRASHPLDKRNPFGSSVHQEVLEAVHDFDAKENAAVFGGFDRFSHTLNCPVGENLFVFTGKRPPRPGTVINAGHNGAAHLFHRPAYLLEKINGVFPDCSIFREHVHVGSHANAVSESEARIRRRPLERVPLRGSHPSDFLGADL